MEIQYETATADERNASTAASFVFHRCYIFLLLLNEVSCCKRAHHLKTVKTVGATNCAFYKMKSIL